MFTAYSDNHKAYRLIDVDTNRLILSRDVFDEERGPFQASSPYLSTKDQPPKATSMGVCLPLAPPNGKDSVDSTIVGSPRHDIAPSDFPQDLLDPHPEDLAPDIPGNLLHPAANVGTSTLRPKWWAKTISDLHDDELIEGRSDRAKSKQNTVNFALMANIHSIYDPQTYTEAKGVPEWEKTMAAEQHSLLKNNTWVLSNLPPKKKPIGCKWVLKVKYKVDGTLDKYKARLVAKGFSQKEGIDYEETFAPTAKMSTIQRVLTLLAQFGWKVHQMDVKCAFLNGDLQEEVYKTQPPSFKVAGKERWVCRLIKALYGLKQVPHARYIKIDKYLIDQGF